LYVIDLPATNRMGNGEVNLGVFCGIIYARLKSTMRLEEL